MRSFLALALLAACGTRTPPQGGPVAPDPKPSARSDAGVPDSGVTDRCTRECPGTCSRDTCIIAPKPGDTMLKCPPGLSCEIDCRGANACQGVDLACADGPCKISCDGIASCTGRISCGAGPCSVSCGNRACNKPIDCGAATGCELKCYGVNACANTISCGPGACDISCGSDSTRGACASPISCASSCGCKVDCKDGSCARVSCPMGCGQGRGCTTTGPNCSRCPP